MLTLDSAALSRVDWSVEFAHLSVNLAYGVFLHILNNFMVIYVPTCIREKRIPWLVAPLGALKDC